MCIDKNYCGYGKAGAGIGWMFCSRYRQRMMMRGWGRYWLDALLSIPPADDDERLGPVLVGCFAPDTASGIDM